MPRHRAAKKSRPPAKKTDPPPGRRTRTRQELRACALERFADRGFDQVSVAEIAAGAGVTERTFYRHFPTKEAVLFEDFVSRLDWFRAALEVRREDEPILDSVRIAVESYPDDREVVRQVARLRADLLHRSVIEGQMLKIQANFAREIERHLLLRLADGDDRELVAAVAANAISGALLAALRVWGEQGGGDTDSLREGTRRALDLLRDLPGTRVRDLRGRDPGDRSRESGDQLGRGGSG